MADSSNPGFAIATRQKDDDLFRTTAPVTAPTEFVSPTRLVSGYGGVRFLIFADVAFRLKIEQAPPTDQATPPEASWVETNRVSSTLNDAGTRQIVCASIQVCGEFMRIRLENTSGAPMTVLELSGLGHPIGEGSSPTGGGGLAAAVNLQDCASDTEESVKPDATAVSPAPCDGGLMISGRDDSGPFQRHIRVDSSGRVITAPTTTTPGSIIGPTPADTAVGVGATEPLPAIPAGTTRMTVQQVGTSPGSRVRVREVGGPAGSGPILVRFGSITVGSAGGSIAALEVEHVAGPATAVTIFFER